MKTYFKVLAVICSICAALVAGFSLVVFLSMAAYVLGLERMWTLTFLNWISGLVEGGVFVWLMIVLFDHVEEHN